MLMATAFAIMPEEPAAILMQITMAFATITLPAGAPGMETAAMADATGNRGNLNAERTRGKQSDRTVF